MYLLLRAHIFQPLLHIVLRWWHTKRKTVLNSRQLGAGDTFRQWERHVWYRAPSFESMPLPGSVLDLGAAEAHLLQQVIGKRYDNASVSLAGDRYFRAVMNAAPRIADLVEVDAALQGGKRTVLGKSPSVIGIAVAATPSRSLFEVAIFLQRFREEELICWRHDRERLTLEMQSLNQRVHRALTLFDFARSPGTQADSDALHLENESLQHRLKELQEKCLQLEEQAELSKEAERKLQNELLEIVQTANSREAALQERQEELRKVADENRRRFDAMREQVKHFEDVAEQVQKKLDQVKQSEQTWKEQATHQAEALKSQSSRFEAETSSLKQVAAHRQRGLKRITRAVFTFSRAWDQQCAQLENKAYTQCRTTEQRLSRVLQQCAACTMRFEKLQARDQYQTQLQAQNLRTRVQELEGNEIAMKRRIQETEQRSGEIERELQRLEMTNAQLVRDLAEARQAWNIATKRERDLHDLCERSKRELAFKEEALKEIQRSLESKENITNELFERVGVLEGQLLATREEQVREMQRSASKVQRARQDIVRKRVLQEAQDFSNKLQQAADAQAALRSNLDARTTSTPGSATRSLASSPLS
jgi:chromosome segregation ATPase